MPWAVVFDTPMPGESHPDFDIRNGMFMIKRGGEYEFSSCVTLKDMTPSYEVALYLYKNGQLLKKMFSGMTGTIENLDACGWAEVSLLNGDAIQVYIQSMQNQPRAVIAGPENTWFAGKEL
jgi:hypothetical protein